MDRASERLHAQHVRDLVSAAFGFIPNWSFSDGDTNWICK